MEVVLTNAVSFLGADIVRRSRELARPVIVAVDGPSGAGKSTFAHVLAAFLSKEEGLSTAVIAGDDFFQGGVELRVDAPAVRAAHCIDCVRQRRVLEALRSEQAASWHAFDWEVFDGSLRPEPTVCWPQRVVVLEGVYSARAELVDLIDIRVLLRVSKGVRLERLLAREGSLGPWELQWHEAEDHYFAHTAAPEWFDLIVEG